MLMGRFFLRLKSFWLTSDCAFLPYSPMLTATFIHAPGVGPATEQALWAQGVTSWHDYLDRARGLCGWPRVIRSPCAGHWKTASAALEEAPRGLFCPKPAEAGALAGSLSISKDRLFGH